MYRSTVVGQEINTVYHQTIPGEEYPDRVWFAEGIEIKWFPQSTLHPLKQDNYDFVSNGYLISSWINGNLKDINKYWHSGKLFSEGLIPGTAVPPTGSLVELEYQTDAETDSDNYHEASDYFGECPSQEVLLTDTYSLVGHRFRYKLLLQAVNDLDFIPRVKTLLLEVVTRIPAKRSWQITFLIADNGTDLNNDRIEETAMDYLRRLRALADSSVNAAPLEMMDIYGIFGSPRVFVDPPTVAMIDLVHIDDHIVKVIGQMTLIEA